jgi:hypothetical protein
MTLYYRGITVRITHEVFESWSPIEQAFWIEELERIHVAGRESIWEVVAQPDVGVCSTSLAGACVVLASVGWPLLDQPVVSFGAAVVGAVLSALAGVCWSARRRPLELRAVYRGKLVCLFRTTDRRVFGQVSRALVRVMERMEDLR